MRRRFIMTLACVLKVGAALLISFCMEGIGYTQTLSADERLCQRALRSYARGDLRAATSTMTSAHIADADDDNLWPEFWLGIMGSQMEPVLPSGIEDAARRISSALENDTSGVIQKELDLLWGLDPKQRGLYAYIYSGVYCSPLTLQASPNPPPSEVDPSPEEDDGFVVSLGSDGYIRLQLDERFSLFLVWDGIVYDRKTHGLTTVGSTDRSRARTGGCDNSAVDGCIIENHDVIFLANRRSYTLRNLNGTWQAFLNP